VFYDDYDDDNSVSFGEPVWSNFANDAGYAKTQKSSIQQCESIE